MEMTGSRQETARAIKESLGLAVTKGAKVQRGWEFGRVPGGFWLRAKGGRAQDELTAAHRRTVPAAA